LLGGGKRGARHRGGGQKRAPVESIRFCRDLRRVFCFHNSKGSPKAWAAAAVRARKSASIFIAVQIRRDASKFS
jgi:hypothetical protein